MHQHGVGLKQDFHLAKRYFDSSAQTQPDARWPVNLALAGLYFHWWYTGEPGGITDKPILRTGPPQILFEVGVLAEARKALARAWARVGRAWERLVPPLEEEEEDEEGEADLLPNPERYWDWARVKENAPALDTVLIGVLTAALLYVLWVRAEQREAARRRRREQAQQEHQD
jgi:SEL1 protein